MSDNAVRRVDHISILVENVDEAMKLYVDTLGLVVVKVENSELHGVRAAFLKAGDVMVELIEPPAAAKPGKKAARKQADHGLRNNISAPITTQRHP